MSDPNSYINEGFHSSLGFVWKERHYLMTFWKIFQTKGSLWRSDRIKSELPCGAVSDRKQHYLLFAQVLFVCLQYLFCISLLNFLLKNQFLDLCLHGFIQAGPPDHPSI